MKRLILFLVCISLGYLVRGQNVRDIIIDETYNGKIFSNFLRELEDRFSVDIIFDEQKIEAYTVAGIDGRTRLLEYLEGYLLNFTVTRINDRVLFIVENGVGSVSRRNDFFVARSSGESSVVIRGKITDAGNGEPIIGAQVFFRELNTGVLTDVNGQFEISIVPQIYHIDVSYVGYEAHHYVTGFSPYGIESPMAISLFPESHELESVTVTADRLDINVSGKLTGVEKLTIETIKSLPTFMGEVDPVRSITTLPGVSTPGELSSGFNVRGGESGQNLILLDDAPVYNPSHLFGFFSAFHPDLVSDVTLFKGSGPANYGGRISSVLDIDLRNGDAGRHTFSGGAGLVASRFAVEGPIVREKSSYILGGRISYADWLIRSTNHRQLQNSSSQFYDLTGKIFHTINENNHVTLSFYHSYDDFNFAADSIFSWGTSNVAFHWDHRATESVSSMLTIFNSRYFSQIESTDRIEPFVYQNGINTTGLKFVVAYEAGDDASFQGGVEGNYLILEPGELDPLTTESNLSYQNMNDQHQVEAAAFVHADFSLDQKWAVSAGLRYSHFLRMGPDVIYTFDYNDIAGRYPALSDSTTYSSGDIIQQNNGIEPRLSLRYLLDKSSALKAGFFRGFQYLHLISNTTATTPQDYWVSSGPYLKPEIGNQYSLGLFKNLKDNQFEISAEGFYKTIDHAVDYIEGADITLNPALEAGLTQGQGKAYGVEFLFRKNGGRTHGWLSYTWSRSLRRVKNKDYWGTIDNGNWYPSAFDKPHNLSVVFNHSLSERIEFSASFNYSTGRPITIPVSKFSYDAYLAVLNYSERNEYRIPDYHRLDISFTFKDRVRRNKRWMGEWVFSVYNLYGRDNAYQIFFSRYGTANKLSVLGSMFPSVTYNFKF